MRIVPFAISAVVTAGLVFVLNKQWGTISMENLPQHGLWQNAEPSASFQC
jgi:penicillin amidase